MRKTIGFIGGALSYLILALPAFAVDPIVVNPCIGTADTSFNLLCFGKTDLGRIVGRGIGFIFIIAALAALGYLVYGGIKWIMSEGDKTAVETARSQITSAIIGLIIIGLSFLVINVILGLFGTDLSTLKLPTFTEPTPQPTPTQ